MITISRAEYEAMQTHLDAQNAELAKQNQKLEAKAAELAQALLQNRWLMEHLKLNKRKLFGNSSEQLAQMVMDKFAYLFNEAEAWDANSVEPTKKAEKGKPRKRRSGSIADVIPEGTPVEVVEHPLPESERVCSVCGSELVEIDVEIHRSLQVEPARFWVRENRYPTYVCKHCEKETGEANVMPTPIEPTVISGSFASPSAIAHLAVQKYVMYSPLYRLEQDFATSTVEERFAKRLEQEKPVLEALLAWANALKSQTAPISSLGKALHYLLKQWPYLVHYLEDGRLEFSNNRAERSIKPFVMGRKNFLFCNTPGGAQSSAVLYSLIETAKETGLDPYRYLLWVLDRAPKLA